MNKPKVVVQKAPRAAPVRRVYVRRQVAPKRPAQPQRQVEPGR